MLVIIVSYVQAQTATNPASITKSGPQIKFDNIIHDFGIIPYMGNGSHIYIITNTGTEPLIIVNCVKGCGCTAVDWTKDPILPGNKGMVKATYNTKIKGSFSRGVDVYSNDPNNIRINLRLKGTVENDPTIQYNQTSNAVKTPVEKW
jgi:hypothetical protein